MTKEYHVFTEQKDTHEQAFIFEVERTEDTIFLDEMWLITMQNNGEVKTRVHLNNMLDSIHECVGGNIEDDSILTILDVFKEVLPDEKKFQIKMDLLKKKIEESSNDSTEKLLKASEYSQILFSNTNDGDLEKLIDSVTNGKKDGKTTT